MRLAILGAGHRPARPNVRRVFASIARGPTIGATLAAALALAPTNGVSAQRAASASCLDTAATIAPARLDDTHLIYVEQETVVANHDGRILVAGAPVFVWQDRGGTYDLLGLDSLFGMVIQPTSRFVHAVPSPLPGRVVKGIRAAPSAVGWWLVVFAEVDGIQKMEPARVLAMWAGETDGSTWRALTKLPAVSDTLDVLHFSALALRDGRARLAASTRRSWRHPVVLFSRDDGHWTARTEDVGLAIDATVYSTATSDLLAVVRPDTTLHEDHNSLFLYTKAPTDTLWTAHPRLWRGGTQSVHRPEFVDVAGGPILVWRTGPILRATSAWVLSLATIPDSAVVPIALPAIVGNLATSSLGNAGVIAIHDVTSPTRDLRLYEYHQPLRVNALPWKATEYGGLLGMALIPGRAVLIASKAATPPRDPAVVSIIETHAWRCPTADARSP